MLLPVGNAERSYTVNRRIDMNVLVGRLGVIDTDGEICVRKGNNFVVTGVVNHAAWIEINYAASCPLYTETPGPRETLFYRVSLSCPIFLGMRSPLNFGVRTL